MSGHDETEKSRVRFNSEDLHEDVEDAPGVLGGTLQLAEYDSSSVRASPGVSLETQQLRFGSSTKLDQVQLTLQHVIVHFAFRCFTILIIAADVVIVIIEVQNESDANGLDIVSMIIVSYFLLEVFIRIFAKGHVAFFKNWIDVLDSIVVVIAFIFTVLDSAFVFYGHAGWARLIVVVRFIRLVVLLRVITERHHLQKSSRMMVSQNKRRYQRGDFDLDLCYITDRVIAMSFPSTGFMAFYRNPILEVVRFLDTKHEDHYKVFNLCSERMYDESLFHYQVERLRIDDHNVPTLNAMLEFGRTTRTWMDADPQNVIAVHCKGGKGRTGTIICVWLIESGDFDKAQDSLAYFGDRRTDLRVGASFQGVETPSQSRYVGYYERIINEFGHQLPPPKKLKLLGVTIHGLPALQTRNGNALTWKIVLADMVYEYNIGESRDCKTKYQAATQTLCVDLQVPPILVNDVKTTFLAPKLPKGIDKCSFYFWFYTSFVESNSLILKRDEIDNLHKLTNEKLYPRNFCIELHFADP